MCLLYDYMYVQQTTGQFASQHSTTCVCTHLLNLQECKQVGQCVFCYLLYKLQYTISVSLVGLLESHINCETQPIPDVKKLCSVGPPLKTCSWGITRLTFQKWTLSKGFIFFFFFLFSVLFYHDVLYTCIFTFLYINSSKSLIFTLEGLWQPANGQGFPLGTAQISPPILLAFII